MPNADIRVVASTSTTRQLQDEPFRPCVTNTDVYSLQSTLDTYREDSDEFALEAGSPTLRDNFPFHMLAGDLLSVVTNLPNDYVNGSIHVSVWIENATVVPLANGVVPLPKRNHDFTWAFLDVTQELAALINRIELGEPLTIAKLYGIIMTPIADVIENLRSSAKY